MIKPLSKNYRRHVSNSGKSFMLLFSYSDILQFNDSFMCPTMYGFTRTTLLANYAALCVQPRENVKTVPSVLMIPCFLIDG